MKVLYQEKPNGEDVFKELQELQESYITRFGKYPNVVELTQDEYKALGSYLFTFLRADWRETDELRSNQILGMKIKIKEE